MAEPPVTPPTGAADDPPADRAEAELALRIERIRALSDALHKSRAETRSARAALTEARDDLRRLRGRRIVRLARRLDRLVARLPGRGGAVEPAPTAAGAASADIPHVTGSDMPGRTRASLDARLGGAGDPIRLTTVGLPPAVARDATAAGWVATERAGDRESDVIVTADPDLDPRTRPGTGAVVAWVDDATTWVERPWMGGYDLVLVPDEATAAAVAARSVHAPVVAGTPAADAAFAAVRAAIAGWAAVPHIDIAIGPPDWDVATRWGDYHYGRALQRAFIARGTPARVRIRPEWDGPGADRPDVVIQLFGLEERRRRSGQLDVLWIISHPAKVRDAFVAEHDLAFVASDRLAAALAERTGRTVTPLHQATDPRRFRPTEGGPAHELLFVANSRGAHRAIVDELTPTARDLAVYGAKWIDERLDPRHLRGEHIPNEDLPAVYSAASIVLDDHWPDMVEWGMLNNRLYDAAACGAFVISDDVPGMAEEFDGGIATFRSGVELRRLVEHYLAAPDDRRAMAVRARAAVLAHHTFDHRADVLLTAIQGALGARDARMPASR